MTDHQGIQGKPGETGGRGETGPAGDAETRRLVKKFVRLGMAWSLVILLAFGGVVWVLSDQADQRRHDQCTNQADFRRTFADVLDKVAHPPARPSSAPGIDFAQVPGFDQLDPAQQAYLRNLAVYLSLPSDNPAIAAILADYTKRFPIPDCT